MKLKIMANMFRSTVGDGLNSVGEKATPLNSLGLLGDRHGRY